MSDNTELAKAYQPANIEERWYEHWEKSNYFHVKAEDDREPFTIVIPPPNVTGSLHMGHALDNTLQDILIRFKRMDGFAALWVPGTDHAGIATQNVVERFLKEKGTNRHELGREKFVENVWEWKKKYGGHIVHQLRRLGSSCDWSRQRFTLDEGLSKAVRTVFVRLYNENLIYRSTYLISWCPRCHTALSDLEVEHHEVDGKLTHFDYPLSDGRKLTVATTRPETMLGDTAIAVHPDDDRYRDIVGKTVKHPLLKREFPIIADAFVDPKFGTGAVKVTPSHDPNDYDMGLRHKLDFITVIDEKGFMSSEADIYAGLSVQEARKKVVQDLKEKGLFQKEEPHKHAVGHCQRCKAVVEPRISKQWFVKIESLAKPAADAVRSGKMKFVPENWSKTYLDWMDNIRDWCISRQLWWGHRIPVWYCKDCNELTVTQEDATECQACKSKNIEQDPDVLDTWFSSGLWPFSTLGWPEQTPDVKKFYPTSVLITGFDIIFFWVARMMMMGLKFMEEVPFKTVHIHALVRDEKGQKMSKSKGNVVDPLQIMDQYGTDAFRFALTSFAVQGRDIALSEKRIEGYRNFITKLWNAARFAFSNLSQEHYSDTPPTPHAFPNRWVRTRLNEVIESVRSGIEEMRFSDAAEALYQFTWHEFCDWYLELVKPHFKEGANLETRMECESTMIHVLDHILRLMHPLTPFVTEELWQRLPIEKKSKTIMLCPYPKHDGYVSKEAKDEFSVLSQTVDAIRNIRSENQIPPSKFVSAHIHLAEGKRPDALNIAEKYEGYLKALGRLESVAFAQTKVSGPTALGLAGDLEIEIPLTGLVDTQAEIDRLQKELGKAEKDQVFLEKRLADPKYRSKAPEKIVAKDEAKLVTAKEKVQKLKSSIASLQT